MSDDEVDMGSALAGGDGRGRESGAAEVGDAGMAGEISRILGKFDHYKQPEDPVMKKRKSKFVEAVEAEKEQRKALSRKVTSKRRQRAKDLVIPEVSLDQTERALRKIATKGTWRSTRARTSRHSVAFSVVPATGPNYLIRCVLVKIGVVMLFNAISAHQKKLAEEVEAAAEEQQTAKEARRRVNSTKLAEARGKLSVDGQKKTFMAALTEKREVSSVASAAMLFACRRVCQCREGVVAAQLWGGVAPACAYACGSVCACGIGMRVCVCECRCACLLKPRRSLPRGMRSARLLLVSMVRPPMNESSFDLSRLTANHDGARVTGIRRSRRARLAARRRWRVRVRARGVHRRRHAGERRPPAARAAATAAAVDGRCCKTTYSWGRR
jgi:hypothetical protein